MDYPEVVDAHRGVNHIEGLTVMLEPWVIEEMQNLDLKDKRLNDRLSEVLSQLGPEGGSASRTPIFFL